MSELPDLSRIDTTLKTRTISPENFTGEPGKAALATEGTGAEAAADLGVGWKISPSVLIKAGETFQLGKITEPGCIKNIWLTTHFSHWRSLVLRVYWDDAEEPAIEVPVGDFFAMGWGTFAQVTSAMIAVNPNGGMNSYWPMPFAKGARFTIENLAKEDAIVYYAITFETGGDYEGHGYLHAQFRRSNPLVAKTNHVLLSDIEGAGQYVGTYVAWGVNSNGWWGEGEFKWFLDDDDEGATITSTGTEDYFGGAWNFDLPGKGYTEFSTHWLGMPQVIRPDGLYDAQQRFGLYRWHGPDPIRFSSGIKRVEVQALGWQRHGRYKPLSDDIASTALFYLDKPVANRPQLPGLYDLAI